MNCKPPCMAIIVKADYPEMIGLPVDVTTESVDFPKLGFCWIVKVRQPIRCWDFTHQCDHINDTLAIPDYCLRPITGLPLHDEQLDEMPA